MPLPSGPWKVYSSQFIRGVTITFTGVSGQVTATTNVGLELTGFFDETAQKLTLMIPPGPAPPTVAPLITYEGNLFEFIVQDNKHHGLSGVCFENFAPNEQLASDSMTGWYATTYPL